MSTDLNSPKSLYQIHSCDKNLSYQLTENYENIRRVQIIFSLAVKHLFKDLTELIEDYTTHKSEFVREGEAIQYSEEEAHSKIGDRIINKVIYHPNVKKIES